MKKIWLLVALVILGTGGTLIYGNLKPTAPSGGLYRTTSIKRGDLQITVSATGTVEPEEVVDVGAQVVGKITLGKDPRGEKEEKFKGKNLDYGSPVQEGMVVAQIDPSIYNAQLAQAEANLAQAQANVAQMNAKCTQAKAEWDRAERLRALKLDSTSPTGSKDGRTLPVKGISDADYILAKMNYDSALANVDAANAAVKQQEAAQQLAATNKRYTTIVSPVSGTILDRRVNSGQTIVSAMSAPSLFLIARDLKRMQVWAQVNEADIGHLQVDTPVHFTVDAFPDELFHGLVSQIRLNASMTSNVVVYTVVITVDNSDLKLLPYLTANVYFEVDHRQNALLVPNAALRYQPRANQIAKSDSTTKGTSPAESAEGDKPDAWGMIWRVAENPALVYPTKVRLGPSDGAFTEILGNDLPEQSQIVMGEQRADAGEVNNPFAPIRFRGKKPAK